MFIVVYLFVSRIMEKHKAAGQTPDDGLSSARGIETFTLHYIFFKVAQVKTSRTTGRNMPHKLQYNVRTRLPKQMSLQFSSEHQ